MSWSPEKICLTATAKPTRRHKGGAECVDPEPRVGGGGGVQPKAEKKIVTSLILMVEVVADVPKGTLDGSARVQNVLELL